MITKRQKTARKAMDNFMATIKDKKVVKAGVHLLWPGPNVIKRFTSVIYEYS